MNINIKLDQCPFCHGGEVKLFRKKNCPLPIIAHYPAKGVVCPARFEQFCDTPEIGAAWWNDRTPKKN